MAYFDDDHEDFSDLDIPDHQRHDTMGYAPVTHCVAQPATTASYRFSHVNNSSNNVTPNTTVKLWSLRNIELKQLCKFCNFKISGRKDKLVQRLIEHWSKAPPETIDTAQLISLAVKARHSNQSIDFSAYRFVARDPAILRISKWQAMQQNHTPAAQTSWCFCGDRLFGKVSVKCPACLQLRHLQCMQTKDYQRGEVCPLCKIGDLQPFLELTQNLIRPILMNSNGIPKSAADCRSWKKQYMFQISEQQRCRQRVVMSCVRLANNCASPSWPRSLRVRINGIDTSDLLNSPFTIVDRLIKPGRNVVALSAQHTDYMFFDSNTMMFVLQLVRPRSVPDMVQTIRMKRSRSFAMGKEKIKEMFSQDEFSAGSHSRVSLACPLQLRPIKIPGRGEKCKHLRCFDLESFLAYNSNTQRKTRFKCPLCMKVTRVRELYVDGFFERILHEMNMDKYEDGDFYCDLFPDGRWSPFVKGARLKRAKTDAMVDLDDSDDSGPAAAAAAASASSATRGLPADAASACSVISCSSFIDDVPDIDDDHTVPESASAMADIFSATSALFDDDMHTHHGATLEDAISLIDSD